MRISNSPFYPLIVIVLVATMGVGFAWSYHDILMEPYASVTTTARPQVLGAATGEPIVGPLAADTSRSALLPSEVNTLFLEECGRPARLQEIDRWAGEFADTLLESFSEMPNC